MAQHKSAKKRVRSTKKRAERNKAALSKVKTLTKKVVDEKDPVKAQSLLVDAVSFLDKTASKGRMHKNTVARRKSSLTKHVNKLAAAK
ncbi:MAG: 30S ribosomal protein S20 [Ignavibacteriae bacterium HGW-Ignavibacteriae-3]|nr:MAG: 30S ribosomal protein S20 [Ignavibacteriae bacterium HGW-Ignavibacteriae-3]